MNTKRFEPLEEELCAGFHSVLTFCVSASACHRVSLRDLQECAAVAVSWRETLSLLIHCSIPVPARASSSSTRFSGDHTASLLSERNIKACFY